MRKAGLFDKFQILNVPRSDISIGAEWIDDIGVSNSSLNSSDIIEIPSIAEYNLNSETDFNVGVKLNILALFGLSGTYQSSTNYDLKIKNASTVRVANMDKLKYSVGRTFVWEGIKVKSISLNVSKRKADSISASFKKINKQIEILPNQDLNAGESFLINGLDLFVAYRLVKFSSIETLIFRDVVFREFQEPLKSGNETKYRTLVNSFEVGSNFSGRFFDEKEYIRSKYPNVEAYKKEQSEKDIWPNYNYDGNCRSILEIQDRTELSNREPKLFKFRTGCGYRILGDPKDDYLKILLSTKIIDSKIVIEELEFNKLTFIGSAFPKRPKNDDDFSHRKIIISIINYIPKRTPPGW